MPFYWTSGAPPPGGPPVWVVMTLLVVVAAVADGDNWRALEKWALEREANSPPMEHTKRTGKGTVWAR